MVFKRNNTAFKKAKLKIKLFSQQTCKKPALFSASMFLKLIFCTTYNKINDARTMDPNGLNAL